MSSSCLTQRFGWLTVRRRVGLSVAVAMLAYLPSAAGFELFRFGWDTPRTRIEVNLPATGSDPDKWQRAFEAAAERWNDATPFHFDVAPSQTSPCARYSRTRRSRDRLNSAGFDDTICGVQFNDGTLAVTLTLVDRLGRRLTESDIVFNSAENWDVYAGPARRDNPDLRRVAVHELGHVLGLDHALPVYLDPPPAIMSPNVSNLEYPQSDDIRGVAAQYGGDPAAAPVACSVVDDLAPSSRIDAPLTGSCNLVDLGLSDDDYAPARVWRVVLKSAGRLDIRANSAGTSVRLTLENTASNVVAARGALDDLGESRLSAYLAPGHYRLILSGVDPLEPGAVSLETTFANAAASVLPVLQLLAND